MGWEYRLFKKIGPASDDAIQRCCGTRFDIYFPLSEYVGLKLRDGDISALELKYWSERSPDGAVEKWKKQVFTSLPAGTVTHIQTPGQRNQYRLETKNLPAIFGAEIASSPMVKTSLERNGGIALSSLVVAKYRTKGKKHEATEVVVMDHAGVPIPLLYHSVCSEDEDKTPQKLIANAMKHYFRKGPGGGEIGAAAYSPMGFPSFVVRVVSAQF